MKEIIQQKLKAIESEKNITILFASESGSRAWGFPSPDSDYDVRFFYMNSKDWYFSIEDKKDQFDFPINDELDINGWDFRKALKLLLKSNASIFEWLQSPIIYFEKDNFKNELWNLCQNHFVPRRTAHHYLGISKNLLEQGIVGKQFKIKKYFYVLRSLLSAKWIIEKATIPPMEFSKLMIQVEDHSNLVQEINALLERKKQSLEGAVTSVQPIIHEFVKEEFAQCDATVDQCEKRLNDSAALNIFFRKTIEKYS